MSPGRLITIIVVMVFLGSSGIVAGGNAHVFSLLPGLQQNASPDLQHSSGYSITYEHISLRTNLSLQTNNPLSVWTQTGSNSYVISVPSGSTFSQYIDPQLVIQGEVDFNDGVFGEQYFAETVYVIIHENLTYIPYTSLGVPEQSVLLQSQTVNTTYVSGSSGYGQQETVHFSAKSMDYNQTNQFNSMFGIVTVSMNVLLKYGAPNGGGFQSYYVPDAISGQMDVFPGTATLNEPDPQAVVIGNGNSTVISGTMNYGTYSLVINGPNDYSKTVSLGTSTRLAKPYSYTFTPTAIGNYTVTLVNSVMELDYQDVFGVTATMPQPTITIDTQTSSGYYLQGQQVNYTVLMQYNTTDPVSFIINIWDGQANQHSVNSAYQIRVNQEVTPAYDASTGMFTYNGSFVVNSNGVAAGYITISASGYYFSPSNGQYLRSVNSGIVTIQVSYHTSNPPPAANYLGYIEGIAVIGIAGVAAYADPDTRNAKIAILGSGIILAMVLMGVIP